MTLIEDVNNKIGKHTEKNKYWESNGIQVIRNVLPYGDYCLPPEIVIDTKRNIDEIAMDISADHDRFVKSLVLAKESGSRFIVLIENDVGCYCVDDVSRWENPRLTEWYKLRAMQKSGKKVYKRVSSRPPISGKQLCKAMKTIAEKYGVTWEFCSPCEAGARVVEILTRGKDV